jgi:predicted  nucleic acid-binding Zn-ribbon protein
MKQGKAKLRVCALCEWIFTTTKETESTGCPQCGFAHYSAFYVYGNAAYRYKLTQKPWKNKRLSEYEYQLDKIILTNIRKLSC